MAGWLKAALFLTVCAITHQATAQASEHLTFQVDTDPAWREAFRMTSGGQSRVFAEGQIAPGDTARFRAFVIAHGLTWSRVVLNSPGGSLAEGVELGKAIRELHFDTEVGFAPLGTDQPTGAMCASSCAYAFAGGVYRFYSTKYARLGIHQFYFEDDRAVSVSDIQIVSGALISYLNEMGVDANAFTLATSAHGNGIVWLSDDQAKSLSFANNGELPTTAEIKLAQMHPYLRLEQESSSVTLRVLLLCTERKQLNMWAGIVTSPEITKGRLATLKRAYVEFDGREVLAESGPSSVHPDNAVIWIIRNLSAAQVHDLATVQRLGIWTENGSDFRWGSTIELASVHSKIEAFADECTR
jgi:hypothetical protein